MFVDRLIYILIIGMFYSTLLVLSASPRNDYWLCCSLHQADVFLWYIQLFVLLSCRWHVNIVRISHFSRHRSSSAALPCTISLWWLFCKTFRIYLSPLNTISTVMLPKDNITVDNMTTWSSEMKIYWNILYFEDWTVSQGYLTSASYWSIHKSRAEVSRCHAAFCLSWLILLRVEPQCVLVKGNTTSCLLDWVETNPDC